jgi:hypothetical protein
MAQPSNTHSTYDAVGNREDLTDFIYDISPTDTPVLNLLPKGKATSTLHEWQIHSLTAASSANAVIEGDDATTDAATVTTKLNNRTQISDKVAQVTGTQEAMNPAGRKSEMAFQMKSRMAELKRDMESSLTANIAKVTGDDTTARKLAGLQTWIKTNISKASDGTAAAGTGADTYTDGTARILTEDMLAAALQSAFTEGGNPSIGIVGAFNKRKVSGFSGNNSRTQDTSDKKLVAAVDVYTGDFHTIKFVPDRFSQADVIYLLDPEYASVCYLRPFQTHELAKTGDTVRKQILVEYTLEMRNEKAHAGVYDLTSS